MSECCGNSDLVGDSFADIIRRLAHIPKTLSNSYVGVSELGIDLEVYILFVTTLFIAAIVIWFISKSSISYLQQDNPKAGNSEMTVSSAEVTRRHAPDESMGCKSP